MLLSSGTWFNVKSNLNLAKRWMSSMSRESSASFRPMQPRGPWPKGRTRNGSGAYKSLGEFVQFTSLFKHALNSNLVVGAASLATISRARTNWHHGKSAPGDTSPEQIQSIKFLWLTTRHRQFKHCGAIRGVVQISLGSAGCSFVTMPKIPHKTLKCYIFEKPRVQAHTN